MLSANQINEFIHLGYLKLENVFSRALAAEGRAILWKDTGYDPNDPSSWIKAVIRLGDYPQEPFRKAVNMPVLHEAFDQLVGRGRWQPRYSLGTFPVRFPSKEDPGDAGWHAEASFYGKDGSMRLNVHSNGRALLMLFLFSDVSEADAPTRILEGSHLDVPALLEPYGEGGLNFIEVAQKFTSRSLQRSLIYATGNAGTVFLCHPFLIHAAQSHHGRTPRFMAQPPLLPSEPLKIFREDGDYSPVEKAIRMGLRKDVAR
jgi:hypothetical protein